MGAVYEAEQDRPRRVVALKVIRPGFANPELLRRFELESAALARLQAFDSRQAEIVELSYFGGMTYPEVGEALGISEATVHRSLRHARAWLRRELAGGEASAV